MSRTQSEKRILINSLLELTEQLTSEDTTEQVDNYLDTLIVAISNYNIGLHREGVKQ